MERYVDKFAEFLQGKGYPKSALLKNTYTYGGENYGRIEVVKDDTFIQAFVLMSEDKCRRLSKFPFYRTYSQRNEYGYLVPPACNVAVCDRQGNWHIHSATNLRVEYSLGFLDYNKAVNRLEKRLKYLGNSDMYKAIKRISIILISFVFLYFIAHVLSINELLHDMHIPLDASVVSLFVIISCLWILPILIPYIRSLSVGVVGFDLEDDDAGKKR